MSGFLPVYMRQLGATGRQITWMFAAGVVCEVLVMMQVGRWTDKNGRKPALLAAFFLMPVRLLLYIPALGPLWVIGVQSLHGLNFGIVGTVSVAFVNDYAKDGKPRRAPGPARRHDGDRDGAGAGRLRLARPARRDSRDVRRDVGRRRDRRRTTHSRAGVAHTASPPADVVVSRALRASQPDVGVREQASWQRQGSRSPDDGQGDSRRVEVDGQGGSGFRPEGEVAVAGENHQPEALARRNDLIVGLEVEGERHELPRREGLSAIHRVVVAAFLQRPGVLWVGPAPRDEVRRPDRPFRPR